MDLSQCQAKEAEIGFFKFEIENLKGLTSEQLIAKKAELTKSEAEYLAMGCGVDLKGEKCSILEKQINSLTDLIATQSEMAVRDNRIYAQIDSWKKQLAKLKLDFDTNGCLSKMAELRQNAVKEVIDTYTAMDKTRIDTKSIKDANIKIFIGASILIIAFTIIVTNKK